MSTLHVGTRKGLFSFTPDEAGRWQVANTSFLGVQTTVSTVNCDGSLLFAALSHGHFGVKLHRSADQGATWDEVAAPAYPPMPEGREPDRCPMRQIEIPWVTSLIWALAADPADPRRLWAGTIPGGLFRSDDAGDSWALVESLWYMPERQMWFGGGYDFPGIHSIAMHPENGDDIVVGVSCGGVWRSLDGGATWALRADGMVADYTPPEAANEGGIQDAHRLVRCAADPDTMWVQHHNGIFKTHDGGLKWERIMEAGPSTFGFAVAVDPRDGDTAWFAPAKKDEYRFPVDGKVVVTRTVDGGDTFTVLRNGLPQDHAYDLIYRHALAISPDGRYLAMGSTTGNLWVSADGGDSWRVVSKHLPPIFSVDFA